MSTYEDAAEAKFLKTLWTGPDGELKNTVFGIYAPDGKTPLTRTGRSPGQAMRVEPATFAAALNKISQRYRPRNADAATVGLPLIENLRLAVNVASCDQLPLVAVVSEDTTLRKQLEAQLAEVAWSQPMVGRALYASVANLAEFTPIVGQVGKPGIVVLSPDAYGQQAKPLVFIPATKANATTIATTIKQSVAAFRMPEKDHRQHVRNGHRQGLQWETVIPVTDGVRFKKGNR